MKLMNPVELGNAKAAELQRDLLRTNEMEENADRVRKKMAQAEDDFKKTLAGQRDQWIKEEEQHNIKARAMEREIEQLEIRKEKALEPVHLKEEEAENLLTKAQNLLTSVKKREDESVELVEVLQNRLDELGEREQDIIANESRARMMVDGAQKQQEQVKLGTAKLTEAIKSFANDRLAWEQDKKREEGEISMRKQSLEAQADSQKRTATELENWELRLKDKEGVIDRKIIRMRNMSPYNSKDTESKL